MSGSHKEFPKKAVAIQLGLAALVGVGYIFTDKPAAHAMADNEPKPIVVAAAKALAPIGKVEVKEASTASAARTGAEVYASGCGTCHDNGVAGAPKLDDKTAWETRLSDGFSALVASAINGKGGMPARGGNPDNTDSEMELAVSHMMKEAGIELVAKSSIQTTSAPATEEKPAMAVKAEEAVQVEAPETKAEETAAEKEEMKAEVKEVTTESKEVVAKTEEVKTETVASVATAKTVVDHSAGEAIYKSSCFACHDNGVAGSPKVGDKAAWAARIEMGTESMYTAAIKGKGAMPAKGGNMSISDEDVKAAVDYMTANSM